MDAAPEFGKNTKHQRFSVSIENEQADKRRFSQTCFYPKFSGANGGKEIFPCSADHKQDWQPYAVDLYSAVCHDHTYMYTYIVLSRVPSTPACYRGTSGFKEKSECICCGHASGIFSPRPLWFGGCATHATPCSVPGYSYFRMCLEKSEHKLLVQCSNPCEFFFIRAFV